MSNELDTKIDEMRITELEKWKSSMTEMSGNILRNVEEIRIWQEKWAEEWKCYLKDKVKRAEEKAKDDKVAEAELWKCLRAAFAGKLSEKIVYGSIGAFGILAIGALGVILFPHKANAAAIFLVNLTNF